MSRLGAWLDERRPEAPPELRAAIDDVFDAVDGDAADVRRALDRGTRDCLQAALAQPGRHRESAFSLLTADALLTYACEAALDEEEPDEALRALLPGVLEDPAGR